MDRSQVIDFACHIKNRDARGKPSQLYSRETALALLELTSNFARDWTKQKPIEALNQAVDAHKARVARLQDVHASWQAFQREHPDKKPADLADQFAERSNLAASLARGLTIH